MQQNCRDLVSPLFFFSKHHQSFDPFQEQKEASFRGLQESAISLALFLDHSMKNSDVTGGDRKNVKNTFDTLLQVGRDFVKFVSLNRIKEITFWQLLREFTQTRVQWLCMCVLPLLVSQALFYPSSGKQQLT